MYNTMIWALSTGNEFEELSEAVVSMFPPIIANNYPLILALLFGYVALHLLKKSIMAILFIAAAAVILTILTNAGIMPNLNEMYTNFADFLVSARELPTFN